MISFVIKKIKMLLMTKKVHRQSIRILIQQASIPLCRFVIVLNEQNIRITPSSDFVTQFTQKTKLRIRP